MKEDLKLVKLNSDYCDYLRNFDSRVPYNYAKKELRPFVGVLFKVHSCLYFAPLSSPKKKHLKMRNKLDFLRLEEGRLGAINFNNMIPVKENNVVLINLEYKCKRMEEIKYLKLLKEQIYWLNRNKEKIIDRSKLLYEYYVEGRLNASTFNRCCNFPLLEQKCLEYNK